MTSSTEEARPVWGGPPPFELVKKVFLTSSQARPTALGSRLKRLRLAAAHSPCANGAQLARLRAEMYFLRRTCRRRKWLKLYLRLRAQTAQHNNSTAAKLPRVVMCTAQQLYGGKAAKSCNVHSTTTLRRQSRQELYYAQHNNSTAAKPPRVVMCTAQQLYGSKAAKSCNVCEAFLTV